MTRRVEITEAAIDVSAVTHTSAQGAEFRFLGVVRGEEDGAPIEGIRYSAYRPMAEKRMQAIADKGEERFGPHRLVLVHRMGFVPVAEPSLLLEVAFPHSGPAFEASRWYLDAVKTTVPVWKEPVPVTTNSATPASPPA